MDKMDLILQGYELFIMQEQKIFQKSNEQNLDQDVRKILAARERREKHSRFSAFFEKIFIKNMPIFAKKIFWQILANHAEKFQK